MINTTVFDAHTEKDCENPCLACQKAAYKLKFQKKADCDNSHCKTTCGKVWELWGQPQSPFEAFRKDSLGKCDVCFRAGFCTITECEAQKKMEKTVIDQIVNGAKLSGFVDNSVMKKLVKKVMKGQPVKFAKYAKKIKKQIKKTSNPKAFKKNFKNIAETLKLLAGASSAKDLKFALKRVESAVSKAKASETVKSSIRKLADNFKGLIESKKGKKSSKKIRKTAKKVKNYIKSELKKIAPYANKIRNSKAQIKSAIEAIKNQSNIKKKDQKKLDKLQKVLANLKKVLEIPTSTEKDIQNTLEIIKKAAAAFKN